MSVSVRTALCFALVAALALTGSAVSPSALQKIVHSAGEGKDYPPKYPSHYVPSRCYYRRQFCCHTYYPCGYVYHKKECTVKSVCVLYKNGWCKKSESVRVCRARCYRKHCLHFHCSPWNINKSKLYREAEPTRVSKHFEVRVTKSKVY